VELAAIVVALELLELVECPPVPLLLLVPTLPLGTKQPDHTPKKTVAAALVRRSLFIVFDPGQGVS
jgi:hypothetical protein